MRYLGGKGRIASKLTAVINREMGAATPCWEPFMGGGRMTEHLARTRRGTASDAHPALMAMWTALQRGWTPPPFVSRDEHERARELPDTDPLKAFIGFGCSFGGMWFASYANNIAHVDTRWSPVRTRRYVVQIRTWAHEAGIAVQRISRAARHWSLECGSFFDRRPEQLGSFIYADPPYADTEGYSTGDFDHAAFWERCRAWAQFVPVLVSEYACPIPHRLLFEMNRFRTAEGVRQNARRSVQTTERLFRVLPPTPRIRTRAA